MMKVLAQFRKKGKRNCLSTRMEVIVSKVSLTIWEGTVEEEGIKEEKDEDGVDHDRSKPGPRDSNIGAGLTQFANDGGYSEEEEQTQMVESRKSPVDNLECGRGNPIRSRNRVSKSTRKSARARNSYKLVAEAKRSRPIRRCVVEQTKKPMDDDECSGSGTEDSEDSTTDESEGKRIDVAVGSSRPGKSQTHLTPKLRLSDNSNAKPTNDKISYLYLDQKGRPIYRCNVCCRKCPQSMLRYHGTNCGKSDHPFACRECGKTFLSMKDLKRHALIHTGEKPFKCSKCPTKFANNYSLKRHMLSHLRRKKRFVCKPCKLSFVSGKELHIHDRANHLGKLPFGCTYCDKRFTSLALLRIHVIVHADEHPFQCPTCGTSFALKQFLRNHICKVHLRSKKTAIEQANQSGIDYLTRETNDQSSFGRRDRNNVSSTNINMLVASHVIKKAKLRLPEGTA